MRTRSVFILSGIIVTATALAAVFVMTPNRDGLASADRALLLPLASPTSPSPSAVSPVVAPVREFTDRITKKRFGMYITPDTSPVDNDRFTGYHNGVDVEFTDTDDEIPVYAIADGAIVFRDWVKGYGGVIVIRHTIRGTEVYALYGHLDAASFPPANVIRVVSGQQIARLGDGLTQETDGVRKHLHFSVSSTEKLDLRGYVREENELSHWLDPLDLYPL